jgi:hypothetical protein
MNTTTTSKCTSQTSNECMVNIKDLGHQIMTNITNIPSTKPVKLDHLTKKATENNVHPN